MDGVIVVLELHVPSMLDFFFVFSSLYSAWCELIRANIAATLGASY